MEFLRTVKTGTDFCKELRSRVMLDKLQEGCKTDFSGSVMWCDRSPKMVKWKVRGKRPK
jgi:hypothetical protein